jgi:hypothetical protein
MFQKSGAACANTDSSRGGSASTKAPGSAAAITFRRSFMRWKSSFHASSSRGGAREASATTIACGDAMASEGCTSGASNSSTSRSNAIGASRSECAS